MGYKIESVVYGLCGGVTSIMRPIPPLPIDNQSVEALRLRTWAVGEEPDILNPYN